MSNDVTVEPYDPDSVMPKADIFDKNQQSNALVDGPLEEYVVEEGEDLVGIFASDFPTVTSKAWATPAARVAAYNNGYKLRTKPGVSGWVATKK